MITSNNVIVHGATTSVCFVPMIDNGTPPAHSKSVCIDANGTPHECQVVYVYDDVVCYITDRFFVNGASICNVTGMCAPVSSTVYIGVPSEDSDEAYKRWPESSIISSTKSDEEGNFSFTNIEVPAGDIL